MEVYTKIDVPPGTYCSGDSHKKCQFLQIEGLRALVRCRLFQDKEIYEHTIKKLPECLALPEALPCGHHPDAMTKDRLADDGYGSRWCVACAKEKR